jgi:REP element-mobilizing transposase RayT
MDESGMQVGKTRYTHYSIAYHLVWIPKYRRRVLTGEVQKRRSGSLLIVVSGMV